MKERLIQLRKSLGLTQAEFGKALGISYAAVSKIESGANNLSPTLVKLICSTYHINQQWLTEGIGEMYRAEDIDEIIDQHFPDQPAFIRSIFKSMMRLPDEDWQKLQDVYNKIKNEGL